MQEEMYNTPAEITYSRQINSDESADHLYTENYVVDCVCAFVYGS